MDENLTLEVTLTEEDLYDFNKSFIYHRMKPKTAFIFGIISVILSLIMLVFFFYSFLPFLLLLFGIINIIIPLTIKKSAIKNYRSNYTLQNPQEYIFNEDGFEIKNATGYGKHLWSNLFGYEENNFGFILFLGNYIGFYIPKRYFNENIEQMRKYLKNCKKSPKRRASGNSMFHINIGIFVLSLLLCIILIIIFMLVLHNHY